MVQRRNNLPQPTSSCVLVTEKSEIEVPDSPFVSQAAAEPILRHEAKTKSDDQLHIKARRMLRFVQNGKTVDLIPMFAEAKVRVEQSPEGSCVLFNDSWGKNGFQQLSYWKFVRWRCNSILSSGISGIILRLPKLLE